MPYSENKEFVGQPPTYQPWDGSKVPNVEPMLLQYVLANAQPNSPQSAIDTIDQFCTKNWMMNVGDQKGEIIKMVFKKNKPKLILQLGTYVGYSSLLMAHLSGGTVHSLEVNEESAEIARKIHQHAGLADRIFVHLGNAEQKLEQVKKIAPFDIIFIDHWKPLYLPDFKILEGNGAIKKGTVVMADNIIKPGVPDYHQFFKQNEQYDSVLYFGYEAYGQDMDAILVSQRIAQ